MCLSAAAKLMNIDNSALSKRVKKEGKFVKDFIIEFTNNGFIDKLMVKLD